ncbi:hypothetical protein ASF91_21560 [Rhizobium sp. Leaf155]|nr:hypothetical protein ASF91_21560 [Rhizobium sp. Leaf155]
MRQVYLDFTDVQDATAVALFQSRVKQVDARITDELSDEQVAWLVVDRKRSFPCTLPRVV